MCNGFIKLYRELLDHPTILSLKDDEHRMFIKLLQKLCYSECQQDDFGILIDLKPGQYMTTLREFAEICGLKKPETQGKRKIEAFFLKLKKGSILLQTLGHRKSILTLVWKPKEEKDGTNFGTNLGQTWDKLGTQKKKEKKYKKEKNILLASEIATSLLSRFSLSLSSNLPEISLEVKKEQAHEFDKLIKQGYEIDQIVDVIEFSHTDSFWRAHVHSPSYLVKKFAKLLIKCQESKKGNQHAATKKYSQHSNSENLDKSGDPKFEAGRSLRF